MTYFLEITCAAAIVACLVNPTPNPPVDRYYKTKSDCYKAALEVDQKWNVDKHDWRMRCLPIKP